MVSAERAGDFATAPDDHGAPQMPDPNAGLPPRYLRTAEAARFLGLSPRTLEKHRIYGPVPPIAKSALASSTRLPDLNAWADLGTRTSTSEPGIGTVLPAKRHAPIPYAGKERR